MNKLLHIHPKDNTATALDSLQIGETSGITGLPGNAVEAAETIAKMHKLALEDIPAGGEIRKYGQPIGYASRHIRRGEHVHTHNCRVGDVHKNYAYSQNLVHLEPFPEHEKAHFQGFHRPSGRVGTRNYIGVMTSVNCSATVARQIANHFRNKKFFQRWRNIDGVVALTHSGGCGMRNGDEGYETLKRTFEGFAKHPNFGGILLIGLGCETMQLQQVMEECGLQNADDFQAYSIQESGGTVQSIARGIQAIERMLPQVNNCLRTTTPASELMLAVQCGGSDAFSGITANPALGVAADLLIRNGGTVIYSETPEIYGAEHLLTQRAISRAVGEQLIERVHWWENYTRLHGFSMDNNPSPGNKQGGLTSILEKSLGAQAKSGTSPLTAVYQYAQPVTAKGLVFMDSPGFDPVSVTGQVASGASVVCFTTGRGSAYGCKPTPCIKLCSNTDVYQSMMDDMDINCGAILDGDLSMQAMGERIFHKILRVASGEHSQSEKLGYGDEEFNPWKIGAVL